MKAKDPDKIYVGPKTRECNVTEGDLMKAVNDPEHLCRLIVIQPYVTNGLLLELYRFYVRKQYNDTSVLVKWIQKLTGATCSVVKLYRLVKELHSKREVLRKKKKKKEIKDLENEVWIAPDETQSENDGIVPESQTETGETQRENEVQSVTTEVLVKSKKNETGTRQTLNSNATLRSPIQRFNRIQNRLMTTTHQLSLFRKRLLLTRVKLRKLNEKVGHYAPKNVKRRERRMKERLDEKDRVISRLAEKEKQIEGENEQLKEDIL